MRVNFYLMENDKQFFAEMPCRLFRGDGFYLDIFKQYNEEKDQLQQWVESVYFEHDAIGIYQRAYLTTDRIYL